MRLKINDLINRIPGFEENQNKRNIYTKILKVILYIYLVMTAIISFLTVLGNGISNLPFTLLILYSPLIILFMNVFFSGKPYILGYRSNKLFKKIIASLYYFIFLMGCASYIYSGNIIDFIGGCLSNIIILLVITLATSKSSRDAYKELLNINISSDLAIKKINPLTILIGFVIIFVVYSIYYNVKLSEIENAVIEYNYEYTEDEIKYFLDNTYNIDEFISEGERRRKEGFKVKKVVATINELSYLEGIDLEVKKQISYLLDSELESKAFMEGYYDKFEGNGDMIATYNSQSGRERIISMNKDTYHVFEKSDLDFNKINVVVQRGMKSLALKEIPDKYKQRSETSIKGAPYLGLERNYITYELASEIMTNGLNQDRINRFISEDNQYVKDSVFKATEYDFDRDKNVIKITKKHKTKTYTFIQENSAIEMYNKLSNSYKEKSWSEINKIYSDIKKNDKNYTTYTPDYSSGSSGYIKWKNDPNYLPSQSELDAMSDEEFLEWANDVKNDASQNLEVKKKVYEILEDNPWLLD